MTKITWRGEFALGILEEDGECKTQHLRNSGLGQDAHDTLNILVRDGYVNVRKPNLKLVMYSITDLGKEYLDQVKLIYKGE